jgi:6-phosphogluconolactonase (cycloisomerase 2 family)
MPPGHRDSGIVLYPMRSLRQVSNSLLFLLLVPFVLADTSSTSPGISITLSPVTAPSAGEPGVTLINVTGSGFPSGSITPALVTVGLQPAVTGSGPLLTATVMAVTTIVGVTRRITFQIVPGNPVQAPTNYLVSVMGSTASGVKFSSANTATLIVNPPASIASLKPNAGQPGQSLTVTITGNFSNFFQGSTQASFGPGISVGGAAEGSSGPVTVNSPTTAVASLMIDPNATPGLRTVSVTTGSEVASVSNGFTVAGPANIFVTDDSNSSVLEYDANGAFIRTFVSPGSGGLNVPIGITFGPDRNLYLSYGACIGPTGILRYDGQTGAFLGAFVPSTSNGGALCLASIVFGPNGNLFADDVLAGNVKEYDGTTGAFIKVFANTSVAPTPLDPLFGPDGNLYVGGATDVEEFNGTTGAFIRSFPQGLGTAANQPAALAFGPDGNLYVGTLGPCCPEVMGEILRYNPTTGALIGVFVPPGSGGLQSVGEIVFRPDGYVYVINTNTTGDSSAKQIMRYNATTGAFVDVFIPAGDGGIIEATSFTFGPATAPPAPTLISLNPNTGQQGQHNLSVNIVGQNTHFIQGTTTASLGVGITVVSLTINSATTATAILNIDPAATLGVRDVALTTGSEIVTLSGGFTVTAAAPIPVLTNLSPNSGQQGQLGVSVAITGQFTHLAQGSTTASFGAGITIVSLTVNSPTSVTTLINIDPIASVGARPVTLTTNAEVVTLNNGFTVTPGTPRLTQVNPNTGQRGEQNSGSFAYVSNLTSNTISVYAIDPSTGVLTLQSLSPVPNPLGIAVTSSGSFLFATNYAPGGTQVGSISVFSINPATGALTPVAGSPFPTGTGPYYVTIAPSGQFLYAANYGSNDVSVYSINANTGVLTPVPGSPFAVGTNPYMVGISPSGQFAYVPNSNSDNISAFSIDSATGVLTPVPGSPFADPGVSQDITGFGNLGAYPTFVEVASSGAFAYVSNGHSWTIAVYSIDPATGALSPIAGSPFPAAPEPGNIVFSSVGQFIYVSNGGTPDSRLDGSVSVYGVNGTTGALTQAAGSPFASGAATTSVAVDSSAPFAYATNAYSNTISAWSINSSAALTPIAGSPLATGSSPETIVIPGAASQLETNLEVTITGQFTHFAQGTSQVSFGSDITVNSVAVADITSLTVNINIPATAALGSHTVTVTTGSEVASLANGFTVIASPMITQVNPSSGQQGQQNLSVNIVGQNTHFVQGTTTTSFGTGITVVSLTITGATTATVVLNIDAVAAPGGRNVTVTTNTEVASLANGFTVRNGTPVLTSVNPSSGLEGQQNLSVNLTGKFTHWLQGTTTATFGAGITLSSLTINSATAATAVLNIDPTAALGGRDVTMTTGSEVAILSGGFSVTGPVPIISSVFPGTGLQSQPLPVTITGQFTNFVQGTTVASFGQGISVGGGPSGGSGPVTVNGSTSATAQLVIDPAATVGARTVSVQTGMEIESLINGFTVVPLIGPTWIQLQPPGVLPPPREDPAVYDPSSDRLISFGGAATTGSSNDTWVLTNANGLHGTPSWNRLAPVGVLPPARYGHIAVYSQPSNRLITFGGILNDSNVWVLSNANGLGGSPAWTELTPTGTPPSPRRYLSAVYDPSSNRMILFGGCTCLGSNDPQATNDVWVLTNADGTGATAPSWVQLTPTGTLPAPRDAYVLAYDGTTNRMAVFGGFGDVPFFAQSFNDVWVLTNANGFGGTPLWVQVSPNGAPGSPPYVDASAGGVYNPSNNHLTIVGGSVPSTAITAVWVLQNANGLGGGPNWTQLSPTGGPPQGRDGGAIIYDVRLRSLDNFWGENHT